jgi:hypothetical protein
MICRDTRAGLDQLSGYRIGRDIARQRLDQLDDIERKPLRPIPQWLRVGGHSNPPQQEWCQSRFAGRLVNAIV